MNYQSNKLGGLGEWYQSGSPVSTGANIKYPESPTPVGALSGLANVFGSSISRITSVTAHANLKADTVFGCTPETSGEVSQANPPQSSLGELEWISSQLERAISKLEAAVSRFERL